MPLRGKGVEKGGKEREGREKTGITEGQRGNRGRFMASG